MHSTELWVIYALAFGAVLLGVQGLYWLFSSRYQEKKTINRRLALGQRLGNPIEVLNTLRRERGLGLAQGIALFAGFEELVLQTGLRFDPKWFVIILLGLVAILVVVFHFAVGLGILGVVVAPTLVIGAVYLYLQLARRKRIARFGEQFPDALDVIVRGLRAGHPFRVALGLVAREMPDPIGSEFGIMADEVSFGLELSNASGNLVRRVGHEDLSFFAIAINIQSQTGGNLAEILSGLANLMRNRAKLRLKIRAITSEGRLSAVFLSLAPFILFGLVSLISPAYFGEILDHPVVLPALLLGLLLLAVGNIIMYRMVQFKV